VIQHGYDGVQIAVRMDQICIHLFDQISKQQEDSQARAEHASDFAGLLGASIFYTWMASLV
jgi:hypothetical protein